MNSKQRRSFVFVLNAFWCRYIAGGREAGVGGRGEQGGRQVGHRRPRPLTQVSQIVHGVGIQGCDSIGLKVDGGADWGAVLVLGGVGGAF